MKYTLQTNDKEEALELLEAVKKNNEILAQLDSFATEFRRFCKYIDHEHWETEKAVDRIRSDFYEAMGEYLL